MSVLINMEMPTSCYDCNCFIRDSDGSDYCCLLMIDIENNNKRDDDCPLVPAADARPVEKAHWYWDKDGMDWNIGARRCSACKARSPMWWNADSGSPMHKSGHRFCPNCGADMREVADD